MRTILAVTTHEEYGLLAIAMPVWSLVTGGGALFVDKAPSTRPGSRRS